MKSAFSRISAFYGVFMQCTMALIIVIAAVTYIMGTPEVSSDLKIIWVSPNKSHKACHFVPNIDLAPQFKFNTKQIFLYLVAKDEIREEIVWYKIVRLGDNYKFTEPEKSNRIFSAGSNGVVEFELRGNIFPQVGLMKDVGYCKLVYKINNK